MSILKVSIPWRTDANGVVRGAAIHDGALVGFHSSVGRQSYLIKNQNLEIVEIELQGVTEFNVVKLWREAIVSEMFAWKLSEAPAQLWTLADGAWKVLFEGKASMEEAKRTATRWTQSMPEAYLFQLVCSYGGQIASICTDIAIYKQA
jgi:hypothetical protein